MGISRSQTSLDFALKAVNELQDRFNQGVLLPQDLNCNSYLETALRLKDYFELALLMIQDASQRKESCGAHFREEFQTPEGAAARDDENYCHISAWQHQKDGKSQLLKEKLQFEKIKLSQRSYK